MFHEVLEIFKQSLGQFLTFHLALVPLEVQTLHVEAEVLVFNLPPLHLPPNHLILAVFSFIPWQRLQRPLLDCHRSYWKDWPKMVMMVSGSLILKHFL